jgi:curved DNA-binding protein CbpA
MATEDDFVAEIMRLYEGLDELSYYDYLGLEPGCDYVAVRDGFYARAQRFHPDQFVHRGGESLKAAVYEVFKRMTEAYNVLLDPELRMLYDDARRRGEARLSGSRARAGAPPKSARSPTRSRGSICARPRRSSRAG